jgi:hypothetical protein
VRTGVFESLVVSRNPVGNTHEDIDGLFGVLKNFLKEKHWTTIDELKELIEQCYANSPFTVIVNVLCDVLDFKAWLGPCIDNKLTKFSRHGRDNFHPGMHYMR